MFSVLDNRRESNVTRQNLLESLLRECQQPTQPLLSELLQYFFQTESSSALTLIKQFNDTGKEQSKILIDHLNNQGLKQSNRHSGLITHTDINSHEEQEKVAHTMKLFRILCLIIHKQGHGLPSLIKDSLLLTNCLQTITRCKDDSSILAQACYFFAALTTTLPSEIVQQTDAILNIFKSTCKYLYKNWESLQHLSIQTTAHSLDNVQLWIVNQSAHALFYTLYTTYPCNFIYQIQREFNRNDNMNVFERIFIPMFQRVRLNPRLLDTDRKRELDKDKRSKQDSYQIIYEARKLSLDPLFGREPPAHRNWMHQEMKKILPFHQFKRQSPSRSLNQLNEEHPTSKDLRTPVEISSKRSSGSPFQKFKEKLRSFVRSSSSTPTTTISTPDVGVINNSNNNSNTLSVPTISSTMLTSPSPALATDIRAVKTMPELPSNSDPSVSSSCSTPLMQRNDQEHQNFVKTVINTISSRYDQRNLPSHWTKILGRYDPTVLTTTVPHRQAIFYVSPSEHSLDNQSQTQPHHHIHIDDSSPTSSNEKRQRCASASCASSQHVHSPVLAAPTTSTDDILSRTQSLSTKQRTRYSTNLSHTSGPFGHKTHLSHQTEYDEDDQDDNVLVAGRPGVDPWTTNIPAELYSSFETKNSLIDDIVWNDHDFISIPHFDFNDIVTANSSPTELKRFDRLYECHSSYEIFLTEQYKKIWENLWAKQKTHQKHFNDLQAAQGFKETLQFELYGHIKDELKIHENTSKCLSDENSLLGGKVVELGKVKSRRKPTTSSEERNKELREVETHCEQLRKTVNNDALKLHNLRLELEDHEKNTKLGNEHIDQLKTLTQNITHLNDLNKQLECAYLRFNDEIPIQTHNPSLTSNLLAHHDEEQQQQLHPYTSTSSTTTNGRDENSELDSVSLNDEHRDEMDDIHQQDNTQTEDYDKLLAEIIEILTNQNSNTDISQAEIEDTAYNLLLEYMTTKMTMQDYLLEHNTQYFDLYLDSQRDFIAQMEQQVSLHHSNLEQMRNVAI